MPNLEPRPTDPAQSVQPRALSSGDLVNRTLEDLPPLLAGRTIRKIQRERAKLAVELSRTQNRATLADADIIAQTKVRSTEEEAEFLLHAQRSHNVARAALHQEEDSRVIDLCKDEQIHTLFKDALHGVAACYLAEVIKRAGN